MARRPWIFASFSAAFALNPGYLTGCASDADDAKFSYDEHDMAAVVAQLDAAGPLSYEADGARYVVHVRTAVNRQEAQRRSPGSALFAAVAHACGTREFLFARPASACIDASELQFDAQLSVTRAGSAALADGEAVQGHFWVPSLHLTGGEISLQTPRVTLQIQAREGEDGFNFEITSLTAQE